MTYHVWTLIGRQNSRKGSTIRALTGIARERDIELVLSTGQQIRIWVRVRSINEPEDAPTAEAWVRECCDFEHEHGALTRRNMLIAFRLSEEYAAPYQAQSYLNAMAMTGFKLKSVVTLGERTPDWVNGFGVPSAEICDVTIPTNEIACQIRSMWGWR